MSSYRIHKGLMGAARCPPPKGEQALHELYSGRQGDGGRSELPISGRHADLSILLRIWESDWMAVWTGTTCRPWGGKVLPVLVEASRMPPSQTLPDCSPPVTGEWALFKIHIDVYLAPRCQQARKTSEPLSYTRKHNMHQRFGNEVTKKEHRGIITHLNMTYIKSITILISRQYKIDK